MSIKQAMHYALDWLDFEPTNDWPEQELEDIHDLLAEAGVAFELNEDAGAIE